MFSVIIPVLNEAAEIEPRLIALQFLRNSGSEIIIVDGGSEDDTVSLASPYADQIISSQPGRAVQMNTGANRANGNILFFLHLDTSLPEVIGEELSHFPTNHEWGFCKIRLSGEHKMLRLIEAMMNIRSRLTSIATGDQGLIISKSLFHKIKGFPEIQLMEDVAICKQLKRLSKPIIISHQVETSSRRWEKRGIYKTMLLMWYLRLLFFFGISPEKLARTYYPNAK